MLNLVYCGPKEFGEYVKNKRIYIFGAGRALNSCLELYFSGRRISGIIDNNEKLWGNRVDFEGQSIEINGANQLCKEIEKNGTKSALLMITSPFYAAEIVESLDKYNELDGLDCFLQVLVRITKEKIPDYEFTMGPHRIPKKIHYIWVGGKPLPEEFKKNIDSWKKYNPDYEIIRWDENNYNFEKNDFIKAAYEEKQWGFASNYARLDVVYNHGGIYLDTDVEAVASFDKLLNDEVFMCMGSADRMNNGCGFGAVKGNKTIKAIMDTMNSDGLDKVGDKKAWKQGHVFLHNAYHNLGFEIKNEYQNRDSIVLYPNEVMSPLTMPGMPDFISDKTVSIHKEAGSWQKTEEKKGMEKLEALIKSGRIK